MKKIIILLLITVGNLYSQTVIELDDFVLSPASDFYSNNYLYGANVGKGNTGIGCINNFDAALLNPASFSLNKNFSGYIQYSYKTSRRVIYYDDYGSYFYDVKPKPLSLSAGFSFKLNKIINTGLLYINNNTVKYHYYPDSPGDELSNNLNVHTVSLPVNVHFEKFAIGINFMYSMYRDDLTGVTTIVDPLNPHNVTNSFERFNIQAGLYFKPSKYFSAGLTFTPGFKSDIKSSEDLGYPVFIKWVSNNPFKISAGVNFITLEGKLNLLLDYNFQRTSEMTGYIDKNNINFGCEYTLNNRFTARAGFFTLFDIRDFHHEQVSFPGSEGDFSQYFLTGGVTYKINNVDISVSIMDSHISPGIIKLFYANSSLLFNF